ncbi:MAG: hypothetical protein Harvfovirus27_1, partial [Harvfovirus sp.]
MTKINSLKNKVSLIVKVLFTDDFMHHSLMKKLRLSKTERLVY